MKQTKNLTESIKELTEVQWQNIYLEHARGERNDIIPFPSEEVQVRTNNQKSEVSAKGAISIFDCIISCVNDAVTSSEGKRILDYGCGWGRMTRLMPYYFDADNITGVDVDESLIISANELFPQVKHRVINSMEQLPFDDDSFDVVFANSVFSHLSEKSCLFTLDELSRVLSKGGVLIISVLQENEMAKFYSNEKQTAWITKILGERKKAASLLKTDGFVWGDTGRWHEYGIAIMSDDWIASKLEAASIKYLGSKRVSLGGGQNYKFGVKF